MAKKTVKKAATSTAKISSNPALKKGAGLSAGRAKDMAWLTPAKIKEIRTDLVSMRDDILKTVSKQKAEEGDRRGMKIFQQRFEHVTNTYQRRKTRRWQEAMRIAAMRIAV